MFSLHECIVLNRSDTFNRNQGQHFDDIVEFLVEVLTMKINLRVYSFDDTCYYICVGH